MALLRRTTGIQHHQNPGKGEQRAADQYGFSCEPARNQTAQPEAPSDESAAIEIQDRPLYQQVEPEHYDQNDLTSPQLPGCRQRGAIPTAAMPLREAGSMPRSTGPRAHGPAARQAVPRTGARRSCKELLTARRSTSRRFRLDQSQVPTMTTQDWQQMTNSIVHGGTAHGMSVRPGGDEAGEEDLQVSAQQLHAVHAAGRRARRRWQQAGRNGRSEDGLPVLPDRPRYALRLGSASGDIIGYGVNEQTGQPVQNGAIHLNQQNIHGIMTHFSNPEKFVNEGLRMQQVANETAKTKASEAIRALRPSTRRYLHDVTSRATTPATNCARKPAEAPRGSRCRPSASRSGSRRISSDLPDQGDAEREASCESSGERQADRQRSRARAVDQIIGEVRPYVRSDRHLPRSATGSSRSMDCGPAARPRSAQLARYPTGRRIRLQRSMHSTLAVIWRWNHICRCRRSSPGTGGRLSGNTECPRAGSGDAQGLPVAPRAGAPGAPAGRTPNWDISSSIDALPQPPQPKEEYILRCWPRDRGRRRGARPPNHRCRCLGWQPDSLPDPPSQGPELGESDCRAVGAGLAGDHSPRRTAI